VLSDTGSGVWLRALTDVTLLALSGQPIDEPIVGYGPFVMNYRSEIVKAFSDLESGRFGRLE
jgi:redox-sensitive bicupin YhaK (pirin superfamily)